MVVITYEPSTVTLPNITVENQIADGVHVGYRLTANEGYVLHDTSSDTPILDEAGNPSGEIYIEYCKQAFIAIRNNPINWTWESVKESEVIL